MSTTDIKEMIKGLEQAYYETGEDWYLDAVISLKTEYKNELES